MTSIRQPRSLGVAAHPPGASARLVNVVIDPLDAFRDIRQACPWALAVATVIVLRFISLLVFYDPALTPLKVVASFAFQIAAVVPPLLLGSAVTWLAARAWRLGVGWRHVFSICAYVTVAYTVATLLFASAAGALASDLASFDVREPPFTNLAFLVRGSSMSLLHRLAAEADVRAVYAAFLLWLGLRAASYPDPREPTGKNAARVVATVAAIRVVGVTLMSLAAS